MLRRLVIALLVLGLSLPALSAPAPQPTTTVSWTLLSVVRGSPGETLDEFALRVAPFMDKYTAEHEVEVCGQISQAENGAYAVELGTIGASLTCAIEHTRIQPDTVAIGVDIHSHPNSPKVRPTDVDRFLAAYQHRPAYREVERNYGRNGFSTMDFNNGPGYLVAGGKVLFQSGPKTVRSVGKLDNPARYRFFDPR